MAERRYRAFISYAHADQVHVEALHGQLESLRVPKALAQAKQLREPYLRPIFRDRDDLSAGADLGTSIKAALDDSDFLIVACSPASAASTYVDQEIRYFKQQRGGADVLAVLIDTNADAPTFPEALTRDVAPDGELVGPISEPLAADVRPEGDGDFAAAKLVAGMLGVPYDDLIQRRAQERNKRLRRITAATTAGMILAFTLALYALYQRDAAQTQRAAAELEAERAQQVVEFLIDTFRVADPETENPREITAVQILERGHDRVAEELTDQPEVQATLLGAIGSVYENLGLWTDATDALSVSLDLDDKPTARYVDRLLRLARSELQLDRRAAVRTRIEEAQAVLDSIPEDAATDVLRGRLHSVAGFLALRLSDVDSAKAELASAITYFDRAYGPSHRDSITARAQLGNIHLDFEEYEAARPLLNAALEHSKHVFGEGYTNTYKRQIAVGQLRMETGANASAIELLQGSIDGLEQITGRAHPVVGIAFLHLARAHEQHDALGDSEAAYRAALEIGNQVYGADHGFLGLVNVHASYADTRLGEPQRALEKLAQAEAIFSKIFPENSPLFGQLYAYRGIALAALGDTQSARETCARAIGILGGYAHKEVGLCRALMPDKQDA